MLNLKLSFVVHILCSLFISLVMGKNIVQHFPILLYKKFNNKTFGKIFFVVLMRLGMCKKQKSLQNFFLTKSFYLEIILMTGNTFFTMLLMRDTILLLLFRRYYFHTRISFTKRELLFLHLIVCQILSQTQQQISIPMGENYELGLSNLTHLYTPITNQHICSILISKWVRIISIYIPCNIP